MAWELAVRKVLFLNHNPVGFGTYYRCFSLGKHLVQRGEYDVTILCSRERKFDFKISTRLIDENFRVIMLPTTGFYGDSSKVGFYLGHLMRVFLGSNQILRLDYDILHSFAVAQPTTAVPTVVSSFFRDKPIFVDWDDAWGDGFAEYHSLLVGKILRYLERNVPRVAQKITVVSECLEQRALDYSFKREDIVRIPNGADVDAIKPLAKGKARRHLGIDEDLPMIVSMGHTYMGNLEMLFEAFSRVVSRSSSAKLFMVGGVEVPCEVEKKHKNLFRNMIFTGEQRFEKIPYYLSAADVLVLPMGDSIIEKARWPIRFGDYLASGQPIVSNAVGEVRRVIEEEKCGLTASPSDVEKFSQIMLELLKDKGLQKQLGKAARRAAEEKYSWSKITGNLAKLYEEFDRSER